MISIFSICLAAYLYHGWIVLLRRRLDKPAGKSFRRKVESTRAASPQHQPRNARKPDWVREAVIGIATHYDNASCRQIEADFNRRHEETNGMTVGKTWVGNLIKTHRALIARLRHEKKQRKPRALPNHLVWGLDITFVQETPVIGILDHGSRTALQLKPLKKKLSTHLLRVLLDAIDAVGEIPKYVRTDNEACFCSRLFLFGLWWLGIRHQRTEVASPWQNGRIERFFGTLKQKLRQVVIDHQRLAENLDTFRFWYNHVRTHQNLNGRTPHEALTKTAPTGTPLWFDAWGGVLQGFLFTPK